MGIAAILWILLPLIGVFFIITGIIVWLTDNFKKASKYLIAGLVCILISGDSCFLALKDFNPN